MTKVAIIGAGIAGLSAAATLRTGGIEPVLFDKGRRPGGRIASRETDGFVFDHGAPFFEFTNGELQAILLAWQTEGRVAPWAGQDRFGGVPSMNAPLQAIAASFDVRCSTTVRALAFDDRRWRMSVEHVGDTKAALKNDPYDHLILAVPAPQAAALLETAGMRLPELDEIVIAPCWSVMLALDGPSGFEEPYLVLPEGPIASIARNDLKPGRAGSAETLVVQASSAWSRAHLEDEAERVAEILLSALASMTGRVVRPVFVKAHRWRYAHVETPLGHSLLQRLEWNLSLCGDWCLGGGIGGALRSGRAVAQTLLFEEKISG